MYAIKNKHFQTVKFLLQCGVDIFSVDSQQKSALVHSASVNSVEMFAMIFESEWPNEEVQANEVEKAFREALQTGNIGVCKYVLDKTDIPIDLSSGPNLLIACCSGSVEAVQFLLSHGATLKPEQKWQGKSALLCAVQSGLYELVRPLLNNPSLKINTEVSPEGYTPLIIAAKYGHNGLIEELLAKGLIETYEL